MKKTLFIGGPKHGQTIYVKIVERLNFRILKNTEPDIVCTPRNINDSEDTVMYDLNYIDNGITEFYFYVSEDMSIKDALEYIKERHFTEDEQVVIPRNVWSKWSEQEIRVFCERYAKPGSPLILGFEYNYDFDEKMGIK